MGTFEIIQQKLESFIRKYYTNELIRGALLFLAIGLLYLLVTLLVEYYLWLSSTGRRLLFWSFILVELLLFARFIVFPLTKLFKFRKGIDHEEASRIIGTHFPEVNDKLLNVIQLSRNKEKSELLTASIDQKANELRPIPFTSAIRFGENLKYLKYVAIPVLIFVLYSSLGGSDIFSSSYTRVVNYDVAYEPPAPFSFVVLNDNLNAIENQSYTLNIRTEGNVVPENVSILYGGETYYMQQIAPGNFEYTFQQPIDPIEFKLIANKVNSRPYVLDVIKTPSLANFEMELNFPAHTGMQSQIVKSTGNATIPEGTRVTWNVSARNTDKIALKTDDSIYSFMSKKDQFNLEQRVFNKLDYTISTSNQRLSEYENLSYTLNVVKDQYPEIDVQSRKDSTDIERIFFLGTVSDDYGLTKLQLVYFPEGDEDKAKIEGLPLNKSNFEQFTYVFPGNLSLEQGVSYEYYFEIFDNDALHNFKSTKSARYSFRKLTQDEFESQQLENQHDAIQGLDRSLEKMRENKEMLEELSRTQKEKTELNYNDQKKLEAFLKRQKQQEEMMRNFSEKMKEELENFQPENKENDPFKEELQKRLEENEGRLKENEELLEELQRLQEKIQNEELIEKLDKMSKQNKNQERNLEQLLELTKRYYVEKKAEKIAKELEKLGEKQEKLADKDESENTKEAQEELNEAFEKLMDELENVKKENEELKNPLDLPDDDSIQDSIQEDQEDALDKLQDMKPQDAGKSQKGAGQKMKMMSQQMMMQMMSGQMDTLEEDVQLLRQILSNLITFSFEQEDLMLTFKDLQFGSPVFGKKLNIQHELKLNFEHIDDSLFAISLRQPTIGNEINTILTDIQFNIEKSLERLAENKLPQGIGNQQYTMKGANDLAVLLDDLLNALQMQLQMPGGGGAGMPMPGSSGDKFQLPDIIQQQQSLIDQMGEGMDGGGEDGDSEGEGKEGDTGEDGDQGNDGNQGNQQGGKQGDGSGQQEGGGGKDGKGGNQDGDGEMNDEGWSGEMFEIYKQQQKLRMELEQLIKEKGLGGVNVANLLQQMQKVEMELLERGFNKGTLQQMHLLKYELLKLEEASYQQGEEEKRQATTNTKEFRNELQMTPEDIKKYFHTNEILNREALPLRNNYKERVQHYFRQTHD